MPWIARPRAEAAEGRPHGGHTAAPRGGCGSLMAAAAPHRSGGAALISAPWGQRQGRGTELCQGRLRLDIRERLCTGGRWARSSSSGQRAQPRAARAEGASVELPDTRPNAGCCCVEPGAGPGESQGALLTNISPNISQNLTQCCRCGLTRAEQSRGISSLTLQPTLPFVRPTVLSAYWAGRAHRWLAVSPSLQGCSPTAQPPASTGACGYSFPDAGPCTCPC